MVNVKSVYVCIYMRLIDTFSSRLSGCMITEDGCRHLLPLLAKDTTHLKELDLSYNHLGDTAQKSLSELAESELKQIKYV